MSRDIQVILLFAFPVLLGLALIFLARWARRKNFEPSNRGYAIDGWNALKKRDFSRAARIYFMATPPEPWGAVIKYLAILVIVTVCVVLLLIVYVFVSNVSMGTH